MQEPLSALPLSQKNREGNTSFEDENFSVYRIRDNQPEFVMTDSILMDPTYIRGGSSPGDQQKNSGKAATASFILFFTQLHCIP